MRWSATIATVSSQSYIYRSSKEVVAERGETYLSTFFPVKGNEVRRRETAGFFSSHASNQELWFDPDKPNAARLERV